VVPPCSRLRCLQPSFPSSSFQVPARRQDKAGLSTSFRVTLRDRFVLPVRRQAPTLVAFSDLASGMPPPSIEYKGAWRPLLFFQRAATRFDSPPIKLRPLRISSEELCSSLFSPPPRILGRRSSRFNYRLQCQLSQRHGSVIPMSLGVSFFEYIITADALVNAS